MSKHSELIGWNDYSYSYGDREIKTINPSIQSGSTVLFERYEDMQLIEKSQYPGVTYGTGGLSTQKSFEEAICKLENGHISRAFPSGINAIICTLMAFTQSGDEVLLTDNVYGPTARFCHKVLAKYNIKITHIESDIGSEISQYINDNTKLIFLESPGSNTFEIQDIPAIVKIAKKAGIPTVIDNTWATPLFLKPLDLGVDISIHSATKYICGYSDVLIGCVTVNKKYSEVFDGYLHAVENYTNSHDCYLALRGLRTLQVRLSVHKKSAFEIARWLEYLKLNDYYIFDKVEPHRHSE